MLEFEYPTTICLHVRDVALTVLAIVDDLLPISGELVFPSTVPLRFILLPRIAMATPFVSPVPNPDFTAPCNHRLSAARTLA
jgi:hypothetical protein